MSGFSFGAFLLDRRSVQVIMAFHPSVISNPCGVGFEDTHHCAHGNENAACSLNYRHQHLRISCLPHQSTAQDLTWLVIPCSLNDFLHFRQLYWSLEVRIRMSVTLRGVPFWASFLRFCVRCLYCYAIPVMFIDGDLGCAFLFIVSRHFSCLRVCLRQFRGRLLFGKYENITFFTIEGWPWVVDIRSLRSTPMIVWRHLR